MILINTSIIIRFILFKVIVQKLDKKIGQKTSLKKNFILLK